MKFSKYMLTKDYSTHNAHSEQDMINFPAASDTHHYTTQNNIFPAPLRKSLSQAFTDAKQHK